MIDWLLATRIVLYFLLYSFVGWIVESTWRTVGERKGFINSGFLHGPIIPIYGFGALIIIACETPLEALALPLRVLILTVVCTAFEYLVGCLYETVFRIKLWDYSRRRFNLHGRICLRNTLCWVLLILAFILGIRPGMQALVERFFPRPWADWASFALAIVAVADAVWSTLQLKATADFINRMRARLDALEAPSLEDAALKLRQRFLTIFPNLGLIYTDALRDSLIEKVRLEREGRTIAEALAVFKNVTTDRTAMDPDWLRAVGDILDDDWFREMGTIHHHDGSLLDHSLAVSQVSWRLARSLGFDPVASARGGLLHDFFLYDWRTRRGTHHPTRHPGIALENARARFRLSPVEEDIILKHMWPITRGFYACKEAFLVSTVDKIVSAREVESMAVAAAKKAVKRTR